MPSGVGGSVSSDLKGMMDAQACAVWDALEVAVQALMSAEDLLDTKDYQCVVCGAGGSNACSEDCIYGAIMRQRNNLEWLMAQIEREYPKALEG